MTLDPLNKLAKVHPDLVAVVKAASQDFPFTVVYGIRTLEAQKAAVDSGHSTTMHSRHLPNAHGLACAVDLAALNKDGTINWAKGDEARVYGHLAIEMKAAAARLSVPIEWGGDWVSFKDWGHFQLPWEKYP